MLQRVRNCVRILILLIIGSTNVANICAQEDHYEITGAKIGEKVIRLVNQSAFDKEYMKDSPVRYRPTSFIGAMTGTVTGSLARYYGYQYYYQGPRSLNYRRKSEYSTDISAVEISDIIYADENGDGILSSGENAQIYFDIINTGDEPIFGLLPIVLSYKTKKIQVSDPIRIDTLEAQKALRYVAEIVADKSIPNGKAYFKIHLHYGQDQNADIQEVCIPTKRRK